MYLAKVKIKEKLYLAACFVHVFIFSPLGSLLYMFHIQIVQSLTLHVLLSFLFHYITENSSCMVEINETCVGYVSLC